MPRPQIASEEALTLLLQSQGMTTAQALANGLRVNRSTISRALQPLGDRVLRLGTTKQASYALRRSVRQAGDRWPLYQIDEAGRAQEWATLHALHGGFHLAAKSPAPAWFRHGYTRGFFPGLPFFLSDVRPQGFMGRATARHLSSVLGVPSDPRNWRDDDVLVYLLTHGDELPGNFVLGERMLEQALHRQMGATTGELVARNDRAARYSVLASRATQGAHASSSAGGEQPKFTAIVAEPSDYVRPVLVKFSPPINSPSGRRWADLLAAEWHALRLLAEREHLSAKVELIDGDSRRFLEVTRFDRVGAHGRRSVITLQAIEAGLLDGSATDWPTVARAMEAAGILSATDAVELRRRWCFGQLTGNTDMHLGNASVWFGDTEPFRLAPAYDMPPMVWMPGAQGEIVPREFVPPPPLPALRDDWHAVMPWAQEFWQRVQDDAQISPEFRALATSAGAAIAKAQKVFG